MPEHNQIPSGEGMPELPSPPSFDFGELSEAMRADPRLSDEAWRFLIGRNPEAAKNLLIYLKIAKENGVDTTPFIGIVLAVEASRYRDNTSSELAEAYRAPSIEHPADVMITSDIPETKGRDKKHRGGILGFILLLGSMTTKKRNPAEEA